MEYPFSFFLFPSLEPLPDFSVSSDASGAIGYGTLWTMNGPMAGGLLSNFHCPLLTRNFLQLFCLGSWWARGRILFHVDNEAGVDVLDSQMSADRNMHLLGSLLKAAACFSFTFAAIHVPGRNNGIADALSHFNFQAFHSQAPQAKKFPILFPPQLLAQLSIVT